MAHHAHNFIIEGGTFNNVGGDSFNIHGNFINGDGELGLQSLGRAASLGAIHDSSERYPPPSCHAETRLEVRRIISDWTKDQNTTSLMLWLYGSVGVGKSAIMQSIAEQLALEQGDLGVATFFFSAGKADRDQGKFLVPTIAYQLAFNVPELRIHINSAMVRNPTLHSKAIPVQMQHLIVEPFRKLAAPLEIVPTVLIDGLDECEDHDIQKLIITLIGEALLKHKLPIRFVIASRPEAHIREALDTAQLRSITHRIPLDDSFQASRDIKKYLADGFRDIKDQKPPLMAQVATPWPEEGVIDLLVQRASGQFIYAATVLKFVGTEYRRPTSQLAIVLQPKPSSAKPFAELDHLYHQILSSQNDTNALVRVLEFLVAHSGPEHPDVEVIEDILGMETGELSLVLRGLHSVIHLPQSPADSLDVYEHKQDVDSLDGYVHKQDGLRFLHASFREYLVNHPRSGPFFIDEQMSCVKIAFLIFELLGKSISQSSSEELHARLRPRTWAYLRYCSHSYFQCLSAEDRHRALDLIHSPIERLWDLDAPPQIQITALHCAMSFLEHQVAGTRKRELKSRPWSERPALWHIIPYDWPDWQPPEETECSDNADKALDEKVVKALRRLHSILEQQYDLMLSTPPFIDLGHSVPGFIAMEHDMPISALADILDIDVGLLESYIAQNQCFMRIQKSGSTFEWPFIRYLCQPRSGFPHHDGRVDCIFLCKRSIYLSVQCHWSQFERCRESTRYYFTQGNLRDLLNAIMILPTDSTDHPLWTFADYLEGVIFYHPGLHDAEYGPLLRIWTHTLEVLIWVHKQQQLIKEMNTSLHANFERKLDAIVDRICQQILSVESTSEGPAITLCPPFLAAIKYDRRMQQVRYGSDPSNSKDLPFIIPPVNEVRNIAEPPSLPHDIRFLRTIYPFLQQYLTSPTRAQGMNISKDTFHTQLAESWFDDLVPSNWDFFPFKSLSTHLMLASGTQKIYAGLRLPMSWQFCEDKWERNLCDIKKFCEDVITWLEDVNPLKRLAEPPLDIYLGYQLLLLRVEAKQLKQVARIKAEEEFLDDPYNLPSGNSDVPPELATQPTADTDSTTPTLTVLPTTNPRWKSVLEGIGDEYHRLALLLLEYFYFVLYWHRRYLV